MKNLRIVLVGPLYPRNIGSCARGMANFGFNDLWIVNPRCEIDEQARQGASRAQDVLKSAKIVNSIEEALFGVNFVCAASSIERPRHKLNTIREISEKIVSFDNVAVLFGREDMGLTSDEMAKASTMITIPTSKNYPSLNLGVSVSLICYELKEALGSNAKVEKKSASREFYEAFYKTLSGMLLEHDYCKEHELAKKMIRIRRIFDHASLDNRDIKILSGVIKSIGE
jgi:tRNA/rRNA methyltransferase